MQVKPPKFLIIRFSAFGDVTQSLSLGAVIRRHFPEAQIHFVTRKDFTGLFQDHPQYQKVWAYDKKSGFKGLLNLALQLRQEDFDYIYDAHNNFRSHLIGLIARHWKTRYILRSIRRWKRLLLFKFRINRFEMPFSGQRDLIEPLQKWGVSKDLPPPPQIFIQEQEKQNARNLLQQLHFPQNETSEKSYVALAPSAAHQLKRWPKNYWIDLIRLLPGVKFVLLGGPEDSFLTDIQKAFPDRCYNTAGKASLATSAALVEMAQILVSNDTGLLHVAEQLGLPAIALMGPAPFGFPSRSSTFIMERNLSCRPCSKHGQGPCKNKEFHKCMVDILPTEVASTLRRMLNSKSETGAAVSMKQETFE